MTAIAGLLTTLCLLGMLPIAPSLAGGPPSLSVTDPTTQLSFTFPGTFQLTRYQDTPSLQPAQREALPRVLVLVERRFQTGPAPIVIGSLPTISLDVLTESRAAFNQVFLKPEFRKTIGRHTVYELPAHQGPVEHQVFEILFH